MLAFLEVAVQVHRAFPDLGISRVVSVGSVAVDMATTEYRTASQVTGPRFLVRVMCAQFVGLGLWELGGVWLLLVAFFVLAG